VAVGPQAGRKVFALRVLKACDAEELFGENVGKVVGFNLYAVVTVRADNRQKPERYADTTVCRWRCNACYNIKGVDDKC
jgi:hypothetical protein